MPASAEAMRCPSSADFGMPLEAWLNQVVVKRVSILPYICVCVCVCVYLPIPNAHMGEGLG